VKVDVWPTPTAHDNHPGWPHRDKQYRAGKMSCFLNDRVAAVESRLLPTPRASEWKGSGAPDSATTATWKDKHYLTGVVLSDHAGQVGNASLRLNGAWVSRLMGFPDGWLDVDDDAPADQMDARWHGDPLNAFADFEAGVPRVATDEPHRTAKLRSLGNAVVPQVPFVIMSAIAEQMRQE